jgi:hypothetical protein
MFDFKNLGPEMAEKLGRVGEGLHLFEAQDSDALEGAPGAAVPVYNLVQTHGLRIAVARHLSGLSKDFGGWTSFKTPRIVCPAPLCGPLRPNTGGSIITTYSSPRSTPFTPLLTLLPMGARGFQPWISICPKRN